MFLPTWSYEGDVLRDKWLLSVILLLIVLARYFFNLQMSSGRFYIFAKS